MSNAIQAIAAKPNGKARKAAKRQSREENNADAIAYQSAMTIDAYSIPGDPFARLLAGIYEAQCAASVEGNADTCGTCGFLFSSETGSQPHGSTPRCETAPCPTKPVVVAASGTPNVRRVGASNRAAPVFCADSIRDYGVSGSSVLPSGKVKVQSFLSPSSAHRVHAYHVTALAGGERVSRTDVLESIVRAGLDALGVTADIATLRDITARLGEHAVTARTAQPARSPAVVVVRERF